VPGPDVPDTLHPAAPQPETDALAAVEADATDRDRPRPRHDEPRRARALATARGARHARGRDAREHERDGGERNDDAHAGEPRPVGGRRVAAPTLELRRQGSRRVIPRVYTFSSLARPALGAGPVQTDGGSVTSPEALRQLEISGSRVSIQKGWTRGPTARPL
jgi:hypothetical protein